MKTPELEQKLLNLITDLDRFRQEKWFTQDVNIFEAVGLTRQEIRHSNFLAFLLNPQQRHGLKDGFLKRVIQKKIDKLAGDPLISPLKIALGDFSDALISREWRNIDLFIESKINQFTLAIENKIDSYEGKTQLQRYEEIVHSEYPRHARLFCYLTAEGEPASRETWSPIGYSDIVDALQETMGRTFNLSTGTRLIIDHYVDLIRRNIVPDQALIDECRKLYALHKDALDLIIEHGQVNSFVSAANTFFGNHTDLKKFEVRAARAGFLPASVFDRVLPLEGTNWWGQSRPLVFWFNFYGGKIGIVVEVGPFSSDKFSREVLVRKLQEYFNNHARIYPKYTRVHSRYMRLSDDQLSDADEILTAMESLYKELAAKHLASITEIVGGFFGK